MGICGGPQQINQCVGNTEFIPLRLKCRPGKSSFEGLSGPSPTTPTKRFERPLPLHMNAQNGGVEMGLGLNSTG